MSIFFTKLVGLMRWSLLSGLVVKRSRDMGASVGGGGASCGREAAGQLRAVVDESTLRRLNRWLVNILTRSEIQFVPSVPSGRRCVAYSARDG